MLSYIYSAFSFNGLLRTIYNLLFMAKTSNNLNKRIEWHDKIPPSSTVSPSRTPLTSVRE